MKALLKSFFSMLLVFALIFSVAGVATAAEKAEEKKASKADDEWKVYWKNGFRVESADKAHKLKFGGRIMNDWLWGNAGDDLPEIISATEFRRARLFVSGTVYKFIEFKAQYDFAGGAEFKDVWLGLKGLPFGTFKIGHMKVPFSLEELTSSKYITFMERSLPNMFAPGRDTGFQITGATDSENLTWGLGLFVDSGDFGEAQHDDAYKFAARVTFLPYSNDGDLFHVGGAFLWHDIQEGETVRFRQRAEAHLLDRYINTDRFAADDYMVLGLEGGAVVGSFHAAGEYMMASVSSDVANDPSFQSFYVYGGYFLTGEQRQYKAGDGAWDRTKVKSAFDPQEGGMGAWELAVRYSWADLNDESIFGGELMDITAALNWYLTNNTVFKFNYIYADVDGLDDGSANIFQMRFQIDF